MSKITFLLGLILCWNQISGQELNIEWPVLKTYTGEYLSEVAMPLGGIGTGTRHWPFQQPAFRFFSFFFIIDSKKCSICIKGKNSRPIGSTYLELQDITQYPKSEYAKKIDKEMQTEMFSFRKARFKKLSEYKEGLNNQEKEELAFYLKIFNNEKSE